MPSFQERILAFYEEQGRDLPWRKTQDPYRILVSEVMLQQTQVDRVIPKYEEWIKTFPTPKSLAQAPLAQVLQHWSGLGYNNRAKRLHDACKIIAEKGFPTTIDSLTKLPGIGPYTARAILIFAFNENIATVDTNIRRILIKELNLKESLSESELFTIAGQHVPKGKSRDYHNALMDYGSAILTARKSGIKPKATQGRFEGSTREVRSAILRRVLKEKKISLKSISEQFSRDDIDAIIVGLEKDGLIRRNRGTISIPTTTFL